MCFYVVEEIRGLTTYHPDIAHCPDDASQISDNLHDYIPVPNDKRERLTVFHA